MARKTLSGKRNLVKDRSRIGKSRKVFCLEIRGHHFAQPRIIIQASDYVGTLLDWAVCSVSSVAG